MLIATRMHNLHLNGKLFFERNFDFHILGFTKLNVYSVALSIKYIYFVSLEKKKTSESVYCMISTLTLLSMGFNSVFQR